MQILNHTHRAGVLALCVVLCLTLTACSVQSSVSKILTLLPVVNGIVQAAGNIVAAVDPGVSVPLKAALLLVGGGFTVIQQILTAWQTNIAGMPPSVLSQLDAAIAAVASNMTNIEQQYPQLPPSVVAALSASLASFQVILTLLASVLPTPAAAMLAPRSFNALTMRGIRFGVVDVPIPTDRAFAQSYNDGVVRAGFKNARVHTPWLRLHGVPVVP